jgi:hypothetical protein
LVKGNVVATLCPRQSRTVYSYIGNSLVYLLIAAELALVADVVTVAILKRRRKQ